MAHIEGWFKLETKVQHLVFRSQVYRFYEHFVKETSRRLRCPQAGCELCFEDDPSPAFIAAVSPVQGAGTWLLRFGSPHHSVAAELRERGLELVGQCLEVTKLSPAPGASFELVIPDRILEISRVWCDRYVEAIGKRAYETHINAHREVKVTKNGKQPIMKVK